jgi:hypothetical protein
MAGLASFLAACASGAAPPQAGETSPGPEGMTRPCTKDADCGEGYSCWARIPRGPMAGVRGSEQAPGTCWSNEVIRQMQ